MSAARVFGARRISAPLRRIAIVSTIQYQKYKAGIER